MLDAFCVLGVELATFTALHADLCFCNNFLLIFEAVGKVYLVAYLGRCFKSFVLLTFIALKPIRRTVQTSCNRAAFLTFTLLIQSIEKITFCTNSTFITFYTISSQAFHLITSRFCIYNSKEISLYASIANITIFALIKAVWYGNIDLFTDVISKFIRVLYSFVTV